MFWGLLECCGKALAERRLDDHLLHSFSGVFSVA